MLRRLLFLPLLLAAPTWAQAPLQPLDAPIVIAHRGASAVRPEHTLAAYAKAIHDGADHIEPDLVATHDGVLIARHENEIGGTTDVAAHPRFADRRTTREVDGERIEGWFAEDFTLAEIRTLRARERLPELRGTAYDGEFGIPTFDEIIAFAAAEATARGRRIVLVPELKHPTYFRARGLALEDRALDALAAHAYTRRTPVILQSFEIGALRTLRERIGPLHGNIRLLQLLGGPDTAPADRGNDASLPSYGAMMQPDGLRTIATYAEYIGPPSRVVVPLAADGSRAAPTPLVAAAHAAGLRVMPYTYRPENRFLPTPDRLGADPRTIGPAGATAEIHAALDAGVDGVFADDPAGALRAVSSHRRGDPAGEQSAQGTH